MSLVWRIPMTEDLKAFYSQSTCPYCGDYIASALEVHEVLVHPEKRARFYTPEYLEWKKEQDASLAKKKRKAKN